MKKTIEKSRVIAFVILFATIIIASINGDSIQLFAKQILESKYPQIVLWAYVLTVSILYFFCVGVDKSQDSLIYAIFGKYADLIYTVSTYGIAGSTSIALLKGLFLQQFYSKQYFTDFSGFDLVTLFLLSSFLLIYCLMKTSIMAQEIVYKVDSSEITPS